MTIDIGEWTPLIALGIYIVIAMARRVGVDRLPERWRWLRPVIIAALVEMADVLLAGAAIQDAVRYAVFAAIGAMGIHAFAKEAGPNEKAR